LFGDVEKAQFIRLMRKQAAFCGVDVLAYAVMSNHFHILLRVPCVSETDDETLLIRYRALYSDAFRSLRAPDPVVLEELFEKGGDEADHWRQSLRKRMGDVSVFMRELKQRFGIWYNHRHGNKGTIWSDRFKSLVVEPDTDALVKVASYIDLNGVRAQLVDDPANDRYCSYGALASGDQEALRGLRFIYRGLDADEAIRIYRICLYGKGMGAKGSIGKDHGKIDPGVASGALSDGALRRSRVRYFSDGHALGSAVYLAQLQQLQPECFGYNRKTRICEMEGDDWGELRVMRRLRT
jgi:hypothetical protein